LKSTKSWLIASLYSHFFSIIWRVSLLLVFIFQFPTYINITTTIHFHELYCVYSGGYVMMECCSAYKQYNMQLYAAVLTVIVTIYIVINQFTQFQFTDSTTRWIPAVWCECYCKEWDIILCWHVHWTVVIFLNKQYWMVAENGVWNKIKFAIKLYRLICEGRVLYFKPMVILWATLWTAPFPVCCNQSNTQSTTHMI
jgi:hypothetical protein